MPQAKDFFYILCVCRRRIALKISSRFPERNQPMSLRSFCRTAALLLMVSGTPALADDIRRETVRFAPGTSGSTITSKVKGYDSVQYSLGVKAGQKMSVQLDSGNASLYFNITAPGASEALYIGSINGNATTVTIPSSGKYVIDVYLMRNAARRGETADYTLTLYVE
jgi:hypothetical protein